MVYCILKQPNVIEYKLHLKNKTTKYGKRDEILVVSQNAEFISYDFHILSILCVFMTSKHFKAMTQSKKCACLIIRLLYQMQCILTFLFLSVSLLKECSL